MGLWMALTGWLLFAGFHIGLSAEPVRSQLVGKMGEKGFQGFYSLIALITFGLLIAGFVLSDTSAMPVFDAGAAVSWMGHIASLLMLLAFILLFAGFANPSPMGMAPTKLEAHGIIRITRHPMNMAFALFGLSHLLVNRLPVDWIFYLGFVLFGVLSSMHQDKKKIRQGGQDYQNFVDSTSILPFGAIVTGKQPLKLSEISKAGLLLGIVGTVVARILHPTMMAQLF